MYAVVTVLDPTRARVFSLHDTRGGAYAMCLSLRGRSLRWPLSVVMLLQPAEVGGLLPGQLDALEPEPLEEIVHPALSGVSRSGR